MSKFYITILLCLIFSVKSFTNTGTNSAITDNNVEWKLYNEVDGIQIYYRTMECNDVKNGIYQELTFLKFVNTTSINYNIEWDEDLWYDEKCHTCHKTEFDRKEDHKKIELLAGESTEGSCKPVTERNILSIFVKFTKYEGKGLTKFEIINLSINPF